MSYRYRIFKFIDRIFDRKCSRCHECGKKLSDKEVQYYSNTCERCESKFLRWLNKLN